MTSRRNFLKSSFLATGYLTAGNVWAVPTEEPSKYDGVYDAIIIGAGGAGLAAAAHAAEAGKKVLVLEKMPFPGGSTILSGGGWSIAGTKWQKKEGIEDTEALYFDDMLKQGRNANDPELVKTMVGAATKEYEWLTKNSDLEPIKVAMVAGMSVPRCHFFPISKLVGFYFNFAKRHGAEFLMDTAAERLLWDYRSKRIIGVKTKNKAGNIKYYKARAGVLLSSGGFTRNKSILAKYCPGAENSFPICGAGNTGDGLLMAQAYGADVLDMTNITPAFGLVVGGKSVNDKTTVFFRGGIVVNNQGVRFISENSTYGAIGKAAIQQDKGQAFIIFDEKIRETDLCADPREPRLVGEKGKPTFGVSADTIEELAKKIGVNPAKLKETVENYNALAPKGLDPLGRKGLMGSKGTPVPIVEPPFVAIPATTSMMATYCGLRVNSRMQVIDVFGNPIPALAACGEICGGFHGKFSMGGTGVGKAISLGGQAVMNLFE